MAEYLVIRIGQNADDLAHWIAVDDSGTRISPPVVGALSAATADTGERKVIVLVPGVDVLTTTVEIPLKSKAKILAALPYALEEFLADDIDDLHFAAGEREENGQVPVSIIKRDKLVGWLERLSDAGISASSIVAENLGLARIPGTISLLISGNQLFINDGSDTDLVMQGASPTDGLTAIGALDDTGTEDDTNAKSRHVLAYCEPGDNEKYSHDWVAMQHDFDSVDVKIMPDGILPRLAVTVGAGAGINLLQGSFGPKAEYSSLFRPWKYAAMLLLVFLATVLIGKTVDYYRLTVVESDLRVRFLNEYRQIVPGASDVRDPVAAVTSLRARTGGTDVPELLLQSLEQLSRALQENQDAQVEAISYRAGVVDIRLSAPNVSVLDNIQQLVDESGTFEAKILSTDQDGETVNSRIQIQAGGA